MVEQQQAKVLWSFSDALESKRKKKKNVK